MSERTETQKLQTRKWPLDWRWLLAILLVFLGGFYFYLMRPDVAGLLYDDGMYLMSAKALASGQGYRLMGIEGQPFLFKYPPLFPICLAALWIVNPHFPANLIWLKSLNILFYLGSLAILTYHFRRNLQFSVPLCLALVACLGLNWHFIVLSIELMTEPLFLLLSAGTIALAYHYERQWGNNAQPIKPQQLAWLTLLSVASFYTRTMGIVLIFSISLWLWSKAKRKATLIYTAVSGLLISPWFIWSALKPDTTFQVGNFLVRSFQETYFESFKMDLRYEFNFLELYSKGIQELLGNFSIHFFPLLQWLLHDKATALSEGLILSLSFGLVCFLGFWAYQNAKTGKISLTGIYLLLYMLILPSWSYFKIYPRFMIVLLPFLLAVFIQAVLGQHWDQRVKQSVIGSFLALIIGTNVIHLWPYIHKPVSNTLLINPYYDIWSDYQATFKFFNERTRPHTVIYNDNIDENYLYGLNTHASVLDFFIFYPKTLLDQNCGEKNLNCILQHLQQRAELLHQLLQQKHAQYVIYQRFSLRKDSVNNWTLGLKHSPPTELMLQAHPQAFTPVMQTPDRWITVYRFHPTP